MIDSTTCDLLDAAAHQSQHRRPDAQFDVLQGIAEGTGAQEPSEVSLLAQAFLAAMGMPCSSSSIADKFQHFLEGSHEHRTLASDPQTHFGE